MSLTSEGNSRNGLKLGGNLQKLGTFYTYPYFLWFPSFSHKPNRALVVAFRACLVLFYFFLGSICFTRFAFMVYL